jgi:hypothetical protein
VATFPQTVGQFYAKTEDKKEFAAMYAVGLAQRFVKLGRNLEKLEFPIIAAIRRAKTPDFAAQYNNFLRKAKESEEIALDFKNSLAAMGADVKIQKVVTTPMLFDHTGFPLEKTEPRSLPRELSEINDLFVQYYTSRHQKTKLMLLADVSQVEVKLSIPKSQKYAARTYTISTDLSCAALLFAIFEKTGSGGVTLRDLAEKVESRNIAGTYLQKLCASTDPVVKRIAKGTKMEDDDRFEINQAFFKTATRFTISPVIRERRTVLMDRTRHEIEGEKRTAVKAAIVRVLKMKNKLEQSNLEADVVQALAPYFRAEVPMIREEITSLETEEYLKRQVSGGHAILTYIS